MKKTITTTLLRDIYEAKGRFFSIVLLIFISTFTLAGLLHVGPTIKATGDQYFDQYNLADFSIISTYGLTKDEQQLITKSVVNGDVEFGYMQDVTIMNSNDSVRIFSKTESISLYEIIEGTTPTKSDEIAISKGLANTYPIGSIIEFKEKGQEKNHVLRTHQFKVVGYVNSTEIISPTDMGPTTIGNGLLGGYAVVVSDTFNSETYMIARITYDDLKGKNTFDKDYQSTMVVHKNELKTKISDLPNIRIQTIKTEANKKLEAQKIELDTAKVEIDDAKKQLDDALATLNSNKIQLDAASSEIANSEQQIADAKVEISTGLTNLNTAQTSLDSSKSKLEKQMQLLDVKQVALNAQKDALELIQGVLDTIYVMADSGEVDYDEILELVETNFDQVDEILSGQDTTTIDDQTLQDIKDNLREQILLAKEQNLSAEDLKLLIETGQIVLDDVKETQADLQVELDNGFSQLAIIQGQLDSKQQELNAARDTIGLKQKELQEKEAMLIAYKNQVSAGYVMYYNGLTEYNRKLSEYTPKVQTIIPKIEDGYKKIEEEKTKISNLNLPVYTIYSRSQTSTSSGYNLFTNLATTTDKVASIFPILLYAVAALVTYTNMSRYIEDQRSSVGTLLALGYQESTIKRKYIIYGIVSSGIGAALGIVIGSITVPKLLYYSFRSDFTTPDLINVFSIKVAIIALLVSILCAVIPALIVTHKEFKSSPANLMLPKPPSIGSKIFLERITIIWNRLSFDRKVTARNIFRNKKRMFMTIFGVSGSVALLFTGLALQGSIGNIAEIQFDEILNYDMIVIEQDDASLKQQQEIDELLSENNIMQSDSVYIESIYLEVGKEQHRQNITLMVGNEIQNYVDLRERKSNEQITIKSGEVIVNEHLAKIMNLEVGDNITVYSKEAKKTSLKIGAITEMYAGHYIFTDIETYNAAFSKPAINNAHIISLRDAEDDNVQSLAIEMLKLDGVRNVMQNYNQISQVEKTSRSLNSIMKLLSLLSILLALVILYNITNINVSERMYELSTTKVLGYLDNEVTFYIYRETVILSILGIFTGYIFGNIIHKYMMMEIAPYNLMFDPRVTPTAYIYPALLIIVTTIVLGIMLHIRLKKVDMLEALKSNE